MSEYMTNIYLALQYFSFRNLLYRTKSAALHRGRNYHTQI